MRLLMNVLLLGLLTIFCNVAAANEEENKAAIAYRQGLYRSILWNFLPMSQMVRGKRGYDAEEIKKRSLAVAYLASLLDEAFPEGSGANSGSTTDALEEIWLNPADFGSQMKNFQREANLLRKVTLQADQNLFTEQFKKLGATCKSCHQKYKAQ